MEMKKVNHTFIVKEESILVYNHNSSLKQCVSFNCYAMQSKKKFHSFKAEIVTSKRKDFDSMNDIYGLATKYGVRANAGHIPKVVGNIAF